MLKEYLDINGLTYLWSKLKTKFSSATNWLNGSAIGSVRTSGSAEENSEYTIGLEAVAEGAGTKASGNASHSEGLGSVASGNYSHAGGAWTIAQRRSQTVIGEYNVADTVGADEDSKGKYVFIIGNGADENNRSNAFTIDWDGHTYVYLKSIDRDASTASDDIYLRAYSVLDQNGELMGYVEGQKYTDGTSGAGFGAVRTINGTDYINAISLGLANDGTRKVRVTSPSAWHTALGINDYVVEQGTKSGGYYRYWNSGKAEFWRRISASSGLTTLEWKAPIYYKDSAHNTAWSGVFNSTPSNVYLSSHESQVFSVYCYSANQNGGTFRLLTCGAKTNIGYAYEIYAIGTWK